VYLFESLVKKCFLRSGLVRMPIAVEIVLKRSRFCTYIETGHDLIISN